MGAYCRWISKHLAFWKSNVKQEAATNFSDIVIESSFDAIISSTLDGIIKYWNPAAEKLYGYTANEAINQPYSIIVSPKKLNRFNTIFNKISQGEHIQNYETLHQHKDGHLINISVTISPINNVHGVIVGASTIAHNITEQILLENALKQKAIERDHAYQELDDFASITSHDLRAPLISIGDLVSWIEEDSYATLDEQSKKHFDLLKKRVHRMSILIEGILNYSRVGRKNVEVAKVDVQLLLENIIKGLSAPPGFNIKIASSMPVLFAAEVLLRQVFSNLIGNAIKHHESPTGTVLISSSKLGNYYQFCVEDDGPGIPKAYQDKIFVIYQTLKSHDEQEAAGIGLAIVKKIITGVGGKIGVESQEGKGAKFYFTWPIQKEMKPNPS